MGDKKRCGGQPRSGEAVAGFGEMLVFRERTHADNVKLEERDDLLLYVEQRRPRKGSQQTRDEIFQVRTVTVSQAGP
jgi:hypothetical protein